MAADLGPTMVSNRHLHNVNHPDEPDHHVVWTRNAASTERLDEAAEMTVLAAEDAAVEDLTGHHRNY
jgi:desulfoferrodoxin (superoxide reductase-like protein)